MKSRPINLGMEDGQAVIIVILALGLFLIGGLGLAIDVGQMYAHRQMAQAAADAAAQAGAMSIYGGTNSTSLYPFGTGLSPAPSVCTIADMRTPCVYARDNGFGGTVSDTVTLSFPSTVSGVTLSSASVPALTVTVQRTLQTGLIRFVGAPATSSITARATAGLLATVSPDCIYVLDPSAASAFSANNGASVTASGCAIAVNSTNAQAASITGGAVVSASEIDVVGGVAINNGGSVTPAAVTGVEPAVDPFASLPSPAPGACGYTNYSPGWGTFTLNPGTYCGGITINNGATATFNPGIYIINGGGLHLGGANQITGSGVMFFLTGTNASYGSVTIDNGQSVVFSAPASGPYLGVLFYQDRSITSSANATFAGGANMQFTGTLYFPTTSISFSNGTSGGGNTAMVAKRISFVGGANIKYDSTGLKTGLFSKAVALVQ